MKLMIPALIRLGLLILHSRLPAHKLHSRIITARQVLRAMRQKQRPHIRPQSHSPARQRRRPIQQRRQALQRARVVAQRIVPNRLNHLRVAAQVLRRHDMLELLPRQQAPDQPPDKHLERAGHLGGREADKGRLEHPAADLAHQLLVLRVPRQREDLAAAHGVAHDEDGHVRRQLVLDKGGDVGHDPRRRPREALLGGLRHAAAPAALVPCKDLDAVLGELGEEVIVAVDVLAEAVDEDDLGYHGVRRLDDGISRSIWGTRRITC